ncbi:MAG: hypothetical protein AB7L90_22305 [Hyphomicrobiaceae bacterium]
MATIITVHGTFAHAEAGTDGGTAASATDLQWWQPNSSFDHDMRELLDASPSEGSGKLDVVPFEWDGHNSELSRRAAGKRLFGELKALEGTGEPYCLVAHSHGGSVVSWALLEGAARKQPLNGLKRWITVGAPFVAMQKERLLFQRLDLLRKVVFVASLMLLLMFLVYILAEAWAGGRMLFGGRRSDILITTAVMMSLPIIFFYLVLRYWDGRTLLHYRRRLRRRAADTFAGRWLSLTHTDDEAVQGLAFLPGAQLSFFDKGFAVQAITTISIFALPLIYLTMLTTPSVMVGLGDWLKANIYDARMNEGAEADLKAVRQQFRDLRRQQDAGASHGQDRRAMWQKFRELREQLEAKYPNLPQIERAIRFRQRFFEAGGQPCEGGKLCGAGRDLRINSGLLLHLVTDELTSVINGEDAEARTRPGDIKNMLVSAVLVPVIFGALSLVLMLVIQALAKVISRAISVLLNNITNAEVKRAAFGNDTEGEIAIGAIDRPTWIDKSPMRLPSGIGDLVTAYSNGVANQSLAKFRRAIGQLASAEPKHTADTAITTYFTWKELVHGSYFDVPSFRKLIAQGISRTEGFAPSRSFQADPDYPVTGQWLAEIEGTPGTTPAPADAPPTIEDAGAVSAVVASTVKREP